MNMYEEMELRPRMRKAGRKVAKKKKKLEFSKSLLIQESILIWINTLVMLYLAYFCVKNQYFGELPWLAAMVGFPWTAYGVSQTCYYKKSQIENQRGGIKYDTVMAEYGYTTDTQAVG